MVQDCNVKPVVLSQVVAIRGELIRGGTNGKGAYVSKDRLLLARLLLVDQLEMTNCVSRGFIGVVLVEADSRDH